jgi:hypothetical protein
MSPFEGPGRAALCVRRKMRVGNGDVPPLVTSGPIGLPFAWLVDSICARAGHVALGWSFPGLKP